MVYVPHKLRLFTHYYERDKTDRSYLTWDNNAEEHNFEDGALALEHLEEGLLGDDDDHAAAAAMPPPSSTLFSDALSLPRCSTSRPPFASVSGDRVGASLGRSAASVTTGMIIPIVQTHRAQEKKMEISRGMRKHP